MKERILNNSYTIRAIAILSIILCHAGGIISNYCFPDIAVSIFFFFTGYFTLYRYYHEKNYLNQSYLLKKVVNIYIPFIISNIIYIIVMLVINKKNNYNLFNAFLGITGINVLNGYSWYIIHILIFYILFYIFFKKKNPVKAIYYYILMFLLYISIVIGLFSIKNYWGGYSLFEHFLLLIGGLFAIRKNDIKISKKKTFKIIISMIYIILLITYSNIKKIVFTMFIQTTSPFFLVVIFNKNKWLDLIGKNSLYLYVFHIPILFLIKSIKCITSNYFYFILTYLLTVIIFSLSFSKLYESINKVIRKNMR